MIKIRFLISTGTNVSASIQSFQYNTHLLSLIYKDIHALILGKALTDIPAFANWFIFL